VDQRSGVYIGVEKGAGGNRTYPGKPENEDLFYFLEVKLILITLIL